MAELIDSSVFIAVERRGQSLDAARLFTPEDRVALSSITASELITGVLRAGDAVRRRRRSDFVEAVLAAIPIVAFDLRVARTHADLSAQLAAAGRTIGAHDLIIAATAVAHGFGVLTENLRDFGRVPGLVVRQPAW